jgi:hypothetical protein
MIHSTCQRADTSVCHQVDSGLAPISNHARDKISWAPAHKLDLRECAKTYKKAINASLSHPSRCGPLAALAIDFIALFPLSDGYAATPEENFFGFRAQAA